MCSGTKWGGNKIRSKIKKYDSEVIFICYKFNSCAQGQNGAGIKFDRKLKNLTTAKLLKYLLI